ncbi:MAG: LacI family DNA-binding transcriptional regulator [Planctomycetota bacterium]
MATVRDIARSLGVSPATVSRSLNQPTVVRKDVRDQVLAEAKRIGYTTPKRKPSRAEVGVEIKAVRPGMLGLLYFNASSGAPFSGYDAIVWGGVTRAAVSLKFGVTVIDPLSRRSGETYADFAERLGVDGFVVRVDEGTRQRGLDIALQDVPHVVVADRFDDEQVNYAFCNSYDASRSAIEHLLSLGHTRIGVGHNTVLDTDHHDRLRAYRDTLAAHGLDADPRLVIPAAADMRGGASVFNQLLALPDPPTAIFFTDPAMTVSALRRSLEVGIAVPDELSIVGVDDEHLRETTYPVYTAVCQDAEQLGFQAARWLCRQIGSPSSSGAAARSSVRTGVPLHLQQDAVLEVNQTTAPRPEHPARISPSGQRLPA